MRGRGLVVATGITLLALASGGVCAASAATSTPGATGQPATPGQPPTPGEPATRAFIQGLVVIATGSVAPLYQTGAIGTPVALASGSDLIAAAFTPNDLTAYVANAAESSVTPVSVVDDTTLMAGPPRPARIR